MCPGEAVEDTVRELRLATLHAGHEVAEAEDVEEGDDTISEEWGVGAGRGKHDRVSS
jgi:hypothetical protein